MGRGSLFGHPGLGAGPETDEEERDLIYLVVLVLVPLGLFLAFIPCIICVFSEIVRVRGPLWDGRQASSSCSLPVPRA